MKSLLAAFAVTLVSTTWAGVVSAQHYGSPYHGMHNNCDCQEYPRGLIPHAVAMRHGVGRAETGYRGLGGTSGYIGPENYGYWSDYGWMGPQYGGWYGPGGWNYYSRTGDYPAPFLPPPSMRGPPPY
jgi:hypothetical protein